MALTVTEADRTLARAQPLTPIALAAAFHRMQARADPQLIEALLPPGATDRDRHEAAFAWAREAGLSAHFVTEILNRRVTAEFLAACETALGIQPDSDLQAILSDADRWIDPDLLSRKLPHVCRQTCKVMIDGAAAGTGFLIAPMVVATAFHVLDRLVEHDGTRLVAREGTAGRLAFDFGHAIVLKDGFLKDRKPDTIPAARDWLFAASAYHPEEKLGLTVTNLDRLKDHYDFVLCRLASLVGIGLDGLTVEREAQLGTAETKITIVQHPIGKPIKYARQSAHASNGIPYRVDHLVNTLGGSSGAPCLNDNLDLVAVHQAGPHDRFGVTVGPANAPPVNGPPMNGQVANRCIPISWVSDLIDNAPKTEPGLMPVTSLPGSDIVLGRSALANWVWRNYLTLPRPGMPAPAPNPSTRPILAIQTAGLQGKSFTARLLRAMLPQDRYRVIAIDMRDLEGLDTMAMLTLLAEAAEIPAGALPDPEGDTTMISHLSRSLVPAFLSALNAGPEPRPTWVMIDNYDDLLLDDREGGTCDLMHLLFAAAGPQNGLFFALAGYTAAREVPELRQKMELETLAPPSELEIENLCRAWGYHDPQERSIQVLIKVSSAFVQLLPQDRNFYARLLPVFQVKS